MGNWIRGKYGVSRGASTVHFGAVTGASRAGEATGARRCKTNTEVRKQCTAIQQTRNSRGTCPRTCSQASGGRRGEPGDGVGENGQPDGSFSPKGGTKPQAPTRGRYAASG